MTGAIGILRYIILLSAVPNPAIAGGLHLVKGLSFPLFGRYAKQLVLNLVLGKGSHPMKLIIAVIQPPKLNAVREALEKIEVKRMTVCDAQGFSRQRGRTEMYRGHVPQPELLRKIALEIVVNDDFLDRTIETICRVARTGPDGTVGDGAIFVMPQEDIVMVSDGSRGPGAV